jgi:hypothetical protein
VVEVSKVCGFDTNELLPAGDDRGRAVGVIPIRRVAAL